MSVTGSFDLVLRNVEVFDGSGAAPCFADVGIVGERIAAVGIIEWQAGQRVVEGEGRALAPGFIDSHTHDDRALLSDPGMVPKVSQGVTTVVTGNCGISLAPIRLAEAPVPPMDLLGGRDWFRYDRFAAYLQDLDAHPPAVNAACQVGHSTLRVRVMEDLDRPAAPHEVECMQALLREALQDGAIGFSTGLHYAPAFYAPPAETEDLARVVREYGGIYTTHMRTEEDLVLEAMAESAALGRNTGVPVVLSHHKVAGPQNYGRSVETLSLMDDLRQEIDIGLDAYPYAASSTILDMDFVKDSSEVMIAWSTSEPAMSGRLLSEILVEWKVDAETACSRLQPAGAVYFQMDEGDVRRILRYPHTMIGSDGLPHDSHPHPRLWGTFPRVLGHYSRDEGLFTLQQAIHRMTGLTARSFGLRDRGIIREGAYADLVLFDRDEIIDCGTFEQPAIPAAGIHTVFVNGRPVWQDGAATGARPGHVLRRQTQDRPQL